MALESKVERCLESHVANSILVGLSRLHGEQWLIGSVPLRNLAIDEDTVGPSNGAATAIQDLPKSGVALGIPVTNKDSVVIFRVSVRDRNE